MPARTGQQYIEGLRAQEREVWLGGERVRDVTRHKGLAGGVRAIAGLYDMQHDAELRSVMTYPSPIDRRAGRPLVRHADDQGGARNPQQDDAELGALDLRHDGPLARFHERDVRRLGRGRRLLRREAARIRRQHAALCRIHPRKRRDADPCADQSAAQPQRLGHVQPRGRHRPRSQARDRCRDHRARRAHPGDPGAARRRDRGLFAAPGAPQRGPQPVRDEFLDPLRHQGPQIPVPRQLRSRPLAFRPSVGLALRGDGLHRLLRRRSGAVGARVPALRCRAAQRDAARHPFDGAFGASGRRQEPRQMRVRAGPRAVDDADPRQLRTCRRPRRISAN